MKTKVIEIMGGPGVGKSTLAADLYCKMKKLGYNVELVGETIKKYCIQGIKRTPWLKLQAITEQIKAEIELYGHIDYIITDSPIYLYVVYEKIFEKTTMMEEIYDVIVRPLEAERITFLKVPNHDYDNSGRWESEEEAKAVQSQVMKMVPHASTVSSVEEILEMLQSQVVTVGEFVHGSNGLMDYSYEYRLRKGQKFVTASMFPYGDNRVLFAAKSGDVYGYVVEK